MRMTGLMAAAVSVLFTTAFCSAQRRAVELSAKGLTLRFSAETGGLTSIAVPGSSDFVHHAADCPLLWRLVLHDRSGKESVVDNTQAKPPEIRRSGKGLLLRWPAVDLRQEPGALDIRVDCRLPQTADTAQLRLTVNNHSRRWGLWNAQFPVIGPLSEKGQPDIAVGRGNWGELYRRAEQPVSGKYPSHDLPMQLMLMLEGGNGLYLAAHDPSARPKEFHLTPGGEFHVMNWADNMGVSGSGWSAPYAFALGVYRGGWMEGCKRYRAWALRDAPWTKKGPLAKRTDVPESIRRTTAWIQGSGPRDEAVPVARKFADAVGAPVGVHWYNWHQIPFDTDYPAYFPAKPGFAQGVAELKSAGVLVMPYINARLWDSANKEFPQARPSTCKDEKGNPLIEEYGSGAKLAVMCPSQPFWQERVGEIIRKLGAGEGVNAVYMDQIGSAAPRFCFDPSHGHPLGSGRWWVDGYRKMLTPIKRWCTSEGRQIALTTENDAEPYMDNIDGFLIWTPRDDGEIPMTTAVYSGYTLYFASNHALSGGDEAFCMLQARDFTWGTELGWEGAGIVQPENAKKLEFQARLARFRSDLADYLVYGELLDVLTSETPVPTLTGKWETWQGGRDVTLSAVHAALWRGRDGSLAVILANADTQPHEFSATIDLSRFGVRSGEWIIISDEPPSNGLVSAIHPVTTGTMRFAVIVQARDGLAVIIRPASTRPARPERSAGDRPSIARRETVR